MELNKENKDMPSIVGYLWKVSKDHDGEVLLQLKIPQIWQHHAMNLPEKVNFSIKFEKYEETN